MDWDPTSHYKDVEIAERYDRERFSRLTGRIFNSLERRCVLKAFSGVDRSQRVLDLPCGTGRMAEMLLENGYKVFGVDISPAMLEVARRKLSRFGGQFETMTADVHKLASETPGAYDVALCARVLMHFPLEEQIAFLRSIAQLSRGTVVFTQSLSTPYQRARRSAQARNRKSAPGPLPNYRERVAGAARRSRSARGAPLSPVGPCF